jgi:hypothetical protein
MEGFLVRDTFTGDGARLSTVAANVIDRTAAAANTKVIVQKVWVCNNTSVQRRVSIGRGSLGTVGNTLFRSTPIGPNETLVIPGPITIGNGADAVLQAQADANDALDLNYDAIIVEEETP